MTESYMTVWSCAKKINLCQICKTFQFSFSKRVAATKAYLCINVDLNESF